jgi:hypothetical protein
MMLDILTVLFFVLGFALILWMVGERRRDVLHPVAALKRASEMPSSMSNVADKLSRVVSEIKRDRNSSEEEPNAKGKWPMLSAMEYPHWLLVAGAVLVVLGFIGFAFSKNINVEPDAGMTAAEVAPKLGRTRQAIYAQLEHIYRKRRVDGKTRVGNVRRPD